MEETRRGREGKFEEKNGDKMERRNKKSWGEGEKGRKEKKKKGQTETEDRERKRGKERRRNVARAEKRREKKR